MSKAIRVRDLGEQGLLKLLQSFCPPDVVGDDAALLSVAAGYSLVVTTDTLVEGVHFSDRTTAAADVGWRAAAANLSDLAAMGASPLGITVGLGLPGEVSVEWVEQLYQGLVDCLQQYGTAIVGGDVCRATEVTVAIAAFGQVLPNQAIRRSTAQPGDAILVTGWHGASRAGLELLLQPEFGQALSPVDRAALIQAHQRPCPRLDVTPILREIINAEQSGGKTETRIDSEPKSEASNSPHYLVSGMDSSDGLADAVLQICRTSGVGAQLERSQIPVPACLYSWLSEAQALEWALYGGEDFELVLCMNATIAKALVKRLGEGSAIIGTITANSTVVLHDRTGGYPDEILSLSKGFQHF